jgi:hypothetical protein
VGAATGTACTPSSELHAAFAGFSEQEVSADANNASCGGGTCLVNHFRGRTSCAYGQDEQGNPPGGATRACTVPGTSDPVRPNNSQTGQSVVPQCTDRRASETVYCSCRCANPGGRTDDGATYCSCPDGFQCAQLVTSIGPATDGTAGAYCMKNRTAYDRASACVAICDAFLHNCD